MRLYIDKKCDHRYDNGGVLVEVVSSLVGLPDFKSGVSG